MLSPTQIISLICVNSCYAKQNITQQPIGCSIYLYLQFLEDEKYNFLKMKNQLFFFTHFYVFTMNQKIMKYFYEPDFEVR